MMYNNATNGGSNNWTMSNNYNTSGITSYDESYDSGWQIFPPDYVSQEIDEYFPQAQLPQTQDYYRNNG